MGVENRGKIRFKIENSNDGISASFSETEIVNFHANSQEELLGVLEKEKSSLSWGATLAFTAGLLTGISGVEVIANQIEQTIHYSSGTFEGYLDGIAKLGIAYLFYQLGDRQYKKHAKVANLEDKINNME